MQPLLIPLVMMLLMTTVTSQIRHVQIPPGALVDIEFEFVNPNSGRSQGQAGSTGAAQGQTGTMGSGMQSQAGSMGSGMQSQAGSMQGGMQSLVGPMLSGMQSPAESMQGGMQSLAGSMRGGMNVMQGQTGSMANGMGMGGMQGMMSPMQIMMRTIAPGMMMPQMTPRMTPQPPMMPQSRMTSQSRMMPQSRMTSQSRMMSQTPQPGTQGQRPQRPTMPAPTSALQQTLTNMLNMALTLRRMHGMSMATPVMEEPCPCGVDCCSRPMEARRILPVFDIPMTLHRGCCGCVDCPISLSYLVTTMIQTAQNTRSNQPSPPAEARK